MFYPRNFPKKLESALINLLLSLQVSFKKELPVNQKKFDRMILDVLKLNAPHMYFKDKRPSNWWLNFILIRHEDRFDPVFVSQITKFLTKTKTRSLSGIVPLTLFTKGTGCPFNCVYCPNEPGVPKSYFSDEPAVMRAARHNYDPYKQTLQRLIMFVLSNHPIDKVESIIKGGTFSFFPKSYRTRFVKRIYDACNIDVRSYIKTGSLKPVTSARNLEDAQIKNETALTRVIGLNIETRPDYINKKEVVFLRKLGVTHVEIGVQALDNDIYKLIRRGHTIQDVVNATRLLKDAGLKVGYHLMPNLPGSTPQNDLKLLEKVFTDESFKPDHLKLYPTTVTKYTVLSEWIMKGAYKPYPVDQLIKLLVAFKTRYVPPWVRIGRLTRDITTTVMKGVPIAPNMREILQKEMEKKNLFCSCIRCREIRDQKQVGTPHMRTIKYLASGAIEYFIEYIDGNNHSLGFLRLRLPVLQNQNTVLFPELAGAAIVRELHIYGQALPIGKKDTLKVQHQSLGKNLLKKAEVLAKKEGIKRIAVIAGIGTREYYRKQGYVRSGTYMIKDLR